MRKPNNGEASENFKTLATNLIGDGNAPYAAFCCLAAARYFEKVFLINRCEQAMVNPTAEAERLSQAGEKIPSV